MKSGEPFSEQFQDFYFSTDGGLEETEYVFLQQNGFPQRFKNFESKTLNIGETGFGTGLNFLVTCLHFLASAPQNSTLHYLAVEKYPLSKIQLQQVYHTFKTSWPQLTLYCEELLQFYPVTFTKTQSSYPIQLFSGKISLSLIINDAATGLEQHLTQGVEHGKNSLLMDAWFLDGFAPAKNPDMWQQSLFNAIAQLSHIGTSISTFTSAGRVRRGLIDAGFKMSKTAGLGKKREILLGVKT